MSSYDEKTLLCTEIFCDKGDKYWHMDEGDIINYVHQGLARMGLIGKNSRSIGACTKKIDFAYPLHYKGFEKSLDQARRILGDFENLYLIGRREHTHIMKWKSA